MAGAITVEYFSRPWRDLDCRVVRSLRAPRNDGGERELVYMCFMRISNSSFSKGCSSLPHLLRCRIGSLAY